jgi:protein SCO1/2
MLQPMADFAWRSVVFAISVGACAPARGPIHADLALFDRPWRWTDEDGNRVTFARWRGTALVIAPVYTSCSQVCPLTVAKMRRVEQAFAKKGRAAQFLLVTFAPESDTPERLRDFKNTEKIPSAWHLLRGSAADTQGFLDALDIHIIDMGSHIVHESRIAVFDGRGALARSFADTEFDEDESIP